MQKHLIPSSLAIVATIAAVACSDEPLAPRAEPVRLAGDRVVAAAIATFTASDMPVEVIDPGQVNFQGPRILWRGLIVRARIEASDPRFTGFLIGTLNANWNLQGEGAVWGRFTHEVDAGGMWEGVWRAHRTRAGEAQWTGEATWSAQGRSGSVQGLRAHGAEVVTSFEVIPTFYVGEMHGRIVGREVLAQP
jgi:hypothetical protein